MPPPLEPPASHKLKPWHLDRAAVVYVRQSSPQQVQENRESTARQYALADYARLLGWPAERVLVIDEDQGQSGARADNRSGYQRLLTEGTLDHVGIVLGLEMSRLAPPAGTLRHLWRALGRPGRRVRSRRPQRPDAAGTQVTSMIKHRFDFHAFAELPCLPRPRAQPRVRAT